jgi:large subunit ribosomal protein L7/L12
MAKQKRLEVLEAKRNQLNARIQALLAREQAQHRKNDTRRKILIGGMVLKMAKSGEMPEIRLRQLLDKYLDAERDRVLFGLGPKQKAEPAPEASTPSGA